MQSRTELDVTAAEDAGMDGGRLEQIATALHQKYVISGKLPHLRLLVSRNERVLLSHVSGAARASGEALQPDSLFRIASMTKPITSVAFMMLLEEGLVTLDDPVTRVLPEFENLLAGMGGDALRQPMRMIDLLRHTSGLTYGLQRQTAIDAEYRRLGLDEFQQKRSSADFIAALSKLPLEFSPSERWNYSVATDVLGVIIERLSGLDLASFFDQQIFRPLRMSDTFFELPEGKVERMTDAWQAGPDHRSSLYDRGARSGWRRPLKLRSGGGGLISTADDYHRFARMLLRGGELDGTRLLKPQTVASMHANHLPGGGDLARHSSSMFSEADYADIGFGLGFATDLLTGEYFWGGVFSTFFFIDPRERIIGLLMTQLLPSNLYPIRREFRAAVQGAMIARANS